MSSRRCFLYIALLTTLCFANGLTGQFVQDDLVVVVNNPAIRSLRNLPFLFGQPYWGPEQAAQGTYRPLSILSHALTYALCGLWPVGYHLGNLVLHALNGWLIFLLARRYTGKPLVGLFTGLIFAAHPVHVDAVAQVVGRTEVLSAFFFLLTWWFFLDAETNPIRKLLGWCCFGLALFSKENTVVWLGVVPLAEMCAGRLKLRALFPRWGLAFFPYYLILGGYLAARLAVNGRLGIGREWAFFKTEPVTVRWLTMIDGFLAYFRLLVFPFRLCVDYDYGVIPKVSTPGISTILGVLLIIALVGLGLWSIRRLPVVGFGVLFFFIAISPVSNIAVLTGILIAERVLYIPSIGFCFLLGYGFFLLWKKRESFRPAVATLFLLVCGLMGWRDIIRNRDWADTGAFLDAWVRVAPTSPKVWLNIGLTRTAPSEKETAFRKAIEFGPNLASPRLELGRFLIARGKEVEGMAEIKRAYESFPQSADANLELALGEIRAGRPAEADRWFEKARLLNPKGINTYTRYAGNLLARSEPSRALEVFQMALEVAPDRADLYGGVGVAFLKLKKYPEAETALFKGLALDPDSDSLRTNYGVSLLAQGKVAEARVQLIEALRLNPQSEATVENLKLIARRPAA